MTLTLLSVFSGVFVVYVVSVWIKYGVLKSISASFFKLQESNLGWIFTIFCFTLSALLFLLTSSYGLWMGVSAAGAGFVGAASMTHVKMSSIVHNVSAGVMIVAALLALLLFCEVWLPAAIVAIIGGTLYKGEVNNAIWWFEIGAFAAIILSLLACYFY